MAIGNTTFSKLKFNYSYWIVMIALSLINGDSLLVIAM